MSVPGKMTSHGGAHNAKAKECTFAHDLTFSLQQLPTAKGEPVTPAGWTHVPVTQLKYAGLSDFVQIETFDETGPQEWHGKQAPDQKDRSQWLDTIHHRRWKAERPKRRLGDWELGSLLTQTSSPPSAPFLS